MDYPTYLTDVPIGELLREAERRIRSEAKALGRGPVGLAHNACATDLYKVRCNFIAAQVGELPIEVD